MDLHKNFYSKRKNLNNIQAEIKRLWIEKRITPVIILDEANYLPSSVLNDLKIIQEIMGHSDITTTMNIYNEATKERKQESFARLEGKIKIC